MCTFFRYKTGDNYIAGKNYDVPAPCYGLAFWNPAGKSKTALIQQPEKPVQWVSRYGNMTFNQVGRDFPASGMNEKGLVVEQTTLWNTVYPDKDDRDAIKELQLIQYLLDSCSTVKEAVGHIERVRISQETAKLQYILSDRNGDICLVEFILGEMKTYCNHQFTHQVITNDMFDTSIQYFQTYSESRESTPAQLSKYSLFRYVATVKALQDITDPDRAFEGFSILNQSQYEDTQWQIIYDLENLSIQWKTRGNSGVNQMHLSDYINDNRCFTIDLNSGEAESYTFSRNLELTSRFFKESNYFQGLSVTDSDIELIASYPER